MSLGKIESKGYPDKSEVINALNIINRKLKEAAENNSKSNIKPLNLQFGCTK